LSDRFLLKGGTVLTLGAKTPNFNVADVIVEGGVITEVGQGLRGRDAEVIDASNTIVMPGFVDSHRHVSRSLLRNEGDQAVSAGGYGPDDVYASTLVGLLGALESGITTVVDWSDIEVDEGHSEAALQAHSDSGLRTVFLHTDLAVLEAVTQRAALSTPAFKTHMPSNEARDSVATEWSAARETGLRIHLHAGVDSSERGLVAAMGSGGFLGSDVTLVHCSNLDPADLDAIASTGSMVALTPSSEMSHGIGAPPVQEFLDRKIRPGLGVDNEWSGQGDMFAQMRAAISLQHATYFDLKLAGKGGLPNLLSTRDVIRWATVDGARVAGLDEVAGSLAPGKQADIVLLRTDRPNIFPINDPIGAVVWGMDTSNVDWVFVAGKPLMRNGVVEADVERARGLAAAALDRVGRPANAVDIHQGVAG
jgi:cytosine/adenosine deaminase-related metal-dependent hydrolase